MHQITINKALQLQLMFDDSLGLLDFKTNLTGYCYIQKQKVENIQESCAALRKHLVKLHNVISAK